MSPISKPAVAVATGVAALALVAGCGASSSTSTGTTDQTTTPASVPTDPKTTQSEKPSGGSTTRATQQSSSTPQSSAPATEFSPPGDIPDNQVFVPYSPPGTTLQVSVPEGWARSSQHGVVTFTDKLNSVGIQVVSQAKPPTVASTRKTEVPALASSVSQYSAGTVSSVDRQGGHAVLITYQQDSAPDAVTGKVIRDAVERYDFWHAGREAIITLSGPVGADNVDPWRIVSDSVTWR
ncbi:MAG: hypothetical protein H0V07_03365 [Propionibacteriales bacterium]|nr:hypothetical protein [Propionibacteriales bacterium]